MARAKLDVAWDVTSARDVKYDVLCLGRFLNLNILQVCTPLFPNPPDQLTFSMMLDGAQTQRVEIHPHNRSLIRDVQNQFRQRISLLQWISFWSLCSFVLPNRHITTSLKPSGTPLIGVAIVPSFSVETFKSLLIIVTNSRSCQSSRHLVGFRRSELKLRLVGTRFKDLALKFKFCWRPEFRMPYANTPTPAWLNIPFAQDWRTVLTAW